ncbi:MAG: D-hexose-6-phosphate mutarotase [Gammaproteobacteria bacterium]|nr:D-hexose-6-phosphate mutarotase [Gammaproteobacteria bacterium]
MTTIKKLNSEFAIQEQLKIVEGQGGFPFIEIDNGKASALISVYAGQVLSFRPVNEPEDLLFLSGQAYYQEGKAIKGGVPICWPWFGPDPEGQGRPGHGFVRNRTWSLSSTEATPEGETKVVLKLKDDDDTHEIWPRAFNLLLEITVGHDLTLALITRNTGENSFAITQAFHTYFKVGDIDGVKVLGLENLRYLDKVDNGEEKIQSGEVTLTAEVDRIYNDVESDLTIVDQALARRIIIRSISSRTAVVWNPWVTIAKQMADLGDEDYKNLICVETANAAEEVVEIPSGGEGRLIARYSIERDQ